MLKTARCSEFGSNNNVAFKVASSFSVAVYFSAGYKSNLSKMSIGTFAANYLYLFITMVC